MSERRLIFPSSSSDEETFLGKFLRQETVGGAVVLVAAVIAVVWANTPWAGAYEDLRHLQLGPLDLEHWAADGALTLFFYIAGLELKREFVVGSLSKPADALVPVAAAACGVLVPALIYTVLNLTLTDGQLRGWAIPAATDIAFALAVLAVVGSRLPNPAAHLPADARGRRRPHRHHHHRRVLQLLVEPAAARPVPRRAGRLRAAPEVPRRVVALVRPALDRHLVVHARERHPRHDRRCRDGAADPRQLDPGEKASPAVRLEHTLTPLSAGVAVPFFALMSAGVAVEGGSELVSDPVVLGVVLGLVVGKPIGVLGGACLVTRVTRAELNPELGWRDLAGVAVLAGVGFTVALLVADLSFTGDRAEAAKTAVLLGSAVAAALASVLLHRRAVAHADE